MAGARGRVPLRDGSQGPVRQGRGGRLPAALRHQGLLHRTVRTHHHAPTHLQGGHIPRRRLLATQVMDTTRVPIYFSVFIIQYYHERKGNV